MDGEVPKAYRIRIEKVNDADPHRNMILRVTDRQLLAKTGGIVQGMSGSPILQNGRLVGAVTHVLVNDPTRGYGIFAQTMLQQARAVEKQTIQRTRRPKTQNNLRVSIFFAKIYQNKPLKVLENYGKIHGVKGTAHIGGNNHGQS